MVITRNMLYSDVVKMLVKSRAVSANLKKRGKSRTKLRKLRDFGFFFVRDFQFDPKGYIFYGHIFVLLFLKVAP